MMFGSGMLQCVPERPEAYWGCSPGHTTLRGRPGVCAARGREARALGVRPPGRVQEYRGLWTAEGGEGAGAW